jgi:hypothetical protein
VESLGVIVLKGAPVAALGAAILAPQPLESGQALGLWLPAGSGSEVVWIQVFNLAGERVAQAWGQPGQARLDIDLKGVSAGVYLVQLQRMLNGKVLERQQRKVAVVN